MAGWLGDFVCINENFHVFFFSLNVSYINIFASVSIMNTIVLFPNSVSEAQFKFYEVLRGDVPVSEVENCNYHSVNN